MSGENKPKYWYYNENGRPEFYPEGWEPPKSNRFSISASEIRVSAIIIAILLFISQCGQDIRDVLTIADLQEQIDYTFTHGKTNIYVIKNQNSPSENYIKKLIHNQFFVLDHYGIKTKTEHLYVNFVDDITGDENQRGSVIAGMAKSFGTDGKGSWLLISTQYTTSTSDIVRHEFRHNQGQQQINGPKGTSIGYQFNVNYSPYCSTYEEMSACYGNQISNKLLGLAAPKTSNADAPYLIYHIMIEELIYNYNNPDVIRYFFNGKNEGDIEVLFYCITGRHSRNVFDFENLHYLGMQLCAVQDNLFKKTNIGNNGMNVAILRQYLRQSKQDLIDGSKVSPIPKQLYYSIY